MKKVQDFINDQKLFYSDSFIQEPIVSVILPTYCRGDNGLLKRAIDSVLAQTFTSFELIIVDDGSVDGTQNLVIDYLSNDDRILYIRNDSNSGLPAVRVNQGLLHARGKYIGYQFDDDQWTPKALDILVNGLQQLKEPSLVYGSWSLYNTATKTEEVVSIPFDYATLVDHNYLANNSVLHHREAFEKHGLYDCNLLMRRVCDWELWLRWGKQMQIIHIDEPVSKVESFVENSLGATVPFDLTLARMFFSFPNTQSLLPQNILDFTVDNIPISLDQVFTNFLLNSFILPWRIKHDESFIEEASHYPTILPQKRIVCVKREFDDSVRLVESILFSKINESCNYLFVPEKQLLYRELYDNDILVLFQTDSLSALHTVLRIKAEDRTIPIIYCLEKRIEEPDYSDDSNKHYAEQQLSKADLVFLIDDSLFEFANKFNTLVLGAQRSYEKQRKDELKHIDGDDGNLMPFLFAIEQAMLIKRIQDKSIIYVVHSDHLGGAEYLLLRHCLLAKNAGFKVVIVLPKNCENQKNELSKLIDDNQIKTIYLSYDFYTDVEGIDFMAEMYKGTVLADAFRVAGLDIALIHSTTFMPAIGYAAHSLGIPYVASLFQTQLNESLVITEDVAEYLPDCILSDSYQYASVWQNKLRRFAFCIRSYVPEEFFQKRSVRQKSQYNLAVIGTVQPRKGQLELIDAIGRLSNKYDLNLFLFGYNCFYPDYITKCKDAIKANNLQQKVFWLGIDQDKRTNTLLAEFDIDLVVSAGTNESVPISLLESLAMEIPVASTPAGAIPEVILNNQTGFLANGFSSADIAEVIDRAIQSIKDDTCIHDIISQAKRFVASECSLLNVSKHLFGLYDESFNQNENRIKLAINKTPTIDTQKLIKQSKIREVIPSQLAFSGVIQKKREYIVDCDKDVFSSVGIIFSSNQEDCRGLCTLQLYSSGFLIRESEIDLESIKDDGWQFFTFDPIKQCNGKQFTVSLNIKYQESSGYIGVYEDSQNRTFLYKVQNKLGLNPKGRNTLFFDFL